jgi:xylose isomerase
MWRGCLIDVHHHLRYFSLKRANERGGRGRRRVAGPGFFSGVAPTRYEWSQSTNPLAVRRDDCGVASKGDSLAESNRNLRAIADLFSARHFVAGAAADPDAFADAGGAKSDSKGGA